MRKFGSTDGQGWACICRRACWSGPTLRGTESLLTCMGLFLSSSFFGYYQFLVRSEETRSSPRRLRSGSLERAEGGQGTETLAELGDLLLCVACVWQRLDA